jgi:hypothetical protein
MNMLEDDLETVLVPRKYVLEVYALVGRLSDADKQTAEVDATGADGDWSSELLRRMYEESPKPMKDILHALAERPGEWLTAAQLADAICDKPDANWNTVAGTLGAFGRRVRNRYKRRSWPFSSQWDHAQGRFLYSMSPEVAAEVTAAASS